MLLLCGECKKMQKSLREIKKMCNFAVQKGEIALTLSHQLAEFERLRLQKGEVFVWSYFAYIRLQ